MKPTVDPSQNSTARTEEMWRDFATPLRNFLVRRTRTREDAEDLLQEVFSRIHRSITDLHDPSKLQGWVYRIARNAVFDYYRSRRENEPLPVEWGLDDPSGRDALDLTPTLRRFIAALPPAYQEPLVRHEFQGEPIANVARALGLSLTATKSRIQRARQKLREMLDQCCAFEFDRRGRVIAANPKATSACESCD